MDQPTPYKITRCKCQSGPWKLSKSVHHSWIRETACHVHLKHWRARKHPIMEKMSIDYIMEVAAHSNGPLLDEARLTGKETIHTFHRRTSLHPLLRTRTQENTFTNTMHAGI